jgi:hypothetical protein
MKTLSLFLGLTLLSGAFAQQPRAESPEPKNLGSVEGRVVNSKTGEPIRRVNLTLRPSGAPGMAVTGLPMPMAVAAPYTASTDGEGKFRIEKVEPGSYQLAAERQGFVRQMYSATQNSMAGVTIRVAAGQSLKEINFKLIPQAIITGRVLDEEGEPLARVQIQLLRRRFFQGRAQLTPTGGGQTIDTGEFRIAELPPGRYWVSANYRSRMMFGEAPARNTGDKPEEDYVTTYYPGSIEQAGARPIELEAGQEMPGVDIRMQKARVYRIRGRVVGAAQPRNLRLVALPRDRSGFMGAGPGPGAGVKEDGSFEIGYVQPGSYYVTAMPMGPQSALGKVAVDVSRDNVENVILTLGGGVTLAGGIRIDGDLPQGKPISFGAIRVQLSPIEGVVFNVPNGTPKEDGSFTLENVGPDKYRIGVFNVPPGTWLKSIRVGDQEVLDTGIDVSGGAPGAVQITLGTGVGQVSGMVRDANQQPVAGLVSLLPDPMKEDRNDLYRTTAADQTGQFTIQNIAPGDYKLFAWGDIEPGSNMDPELLKLHESKAEKITIKPNSQQNVTLTQIPADAR